MKAKFASAMRNLFGPLWVAALRMVGYGAVLFIVGQLVHTFAPQFDIIAEPVRMGGALVGSVGLLYAASAFGRFGPELGGMRHRKDDGDG